MVGDAASAPLRDLLVTTKDGDWGRDSPEEGYVPYRVIRGTDFPGVRIGDVSSVPVRYLGESTVHRRTLEPDDILLETAGGSRDRPTGRSLLITERLLSSLDLPVTCASFARFLRVDRGKADPHYVYWHLQHLYANGEMEEHQVQHTGVARFQYTKFAETQRIPLPALPEQRAIAHILDTLDNKIELNRRMNETLEAMARAIFKSWFVDFDPVRAKAEGRLPAGRQATPPPPKPGAWFVYALECENGSVYVGHAEDVQRRFDEHARGKGAEWTKRHPPRRIAYWEDLSTRAAAAARERKLKTGSGRKWLKQEIARRDLSSGGLPKVLADLFPDRFEDSELGEIPKGWAVGALGDVAEHPRRGVQPTEIEPSTPYIALEHMPRRCIALSEWGTADGLESNKFEFKRGEILFGKLRPYFHKVGVAPVDGVCSTDIVVVTPRAEHWFGFVLGHVSSEAFVEYTNAGSTGTKMPRTSWGDMSRYSVALPPDPIAAAFTDQARPSVTRILAAIHESRTLAALRDTLLLKLLSGEIRVKDAERLAEESA